MIPACEPEGQVTFDELVEPEFGDDAGPDVAGTRRREDDVAGTPRREGVIRWSYLNECMLFISKFIPLSAR